MNSQTSFEGIDPQGLVSSQELEPLYLKNIREDKIFEASFRIYGAEGTENEDPEYGRKDIHLSLTASPGFGVFIDHWYRHGKQGICYCSVSDLSKINQLIKVDDDMYRCVAFFIPPEKAWLAIKDFLDNPGMRSDKIEWIDYSEVSNRIPNPYKEEGVIVNRLNDK